jgi:hypothetical protein
LWPLWPPRYRTFSRAKKKCPHRLPSCSARLSSWAGRWSAGSRHADRRGRVREVQYLRHQDRAGRADENHVAVPAQHDPPDGPGPVLVHALAQNIVGMLGSGTAPGPRSRPPSSQHGERHLVRVPKCQSLLRTDRINSERCADVRWVCGLELHILSYRRCSPLLPTLPVDDTLV